MSCFKNEIPHLICLQWPILYLASIHSKQANSELQCQLFSTHPSAWCLTLSFCLNPFYSCPLLRAGITQMPSHQPLLLQPHMFMLSHFSHSLQISRHNPDTVKKSMSLFLHCQLTVTTKKNIKPISYIQIINKYRKLMRMSCDFPNNSFNLSYPFYFLIYQLISLTDNSEKRLS